MHTREVAASVDVEPSQVSKLKPGADDAEVATHHPEKKRKTGGGDEDIGEERGEETVEEICTSDLLRNLTKFILSEAPDPKAVSLEQVREKLAKAMRMIGSAAMSSYDLNQREAAIREWIVQCAEELECDEGNSDEDIADDGYEASKNVDLRSVTGRKEEDVQLPDKRDPTEMPTVPMSTHAPQRKVAHELYDKIIATMNEANFTDFQLFILVPNLNSLYNQTVNRLENFIQELRQQDQYRAFLAGRDAAGRVFKAGLGDANRTTHSILEQTIKEQPETLFLIIHDEAHYEATRDPGNQQKATRDPENREKAVNLYMNSKTVLDSTNVITLLVSATPYNLVSSNSRIPEDNIVDWMKVIEAQGEMESHYFGLAKYVERSRINLEAGTDVAAKDKVRCDGSCAACLGADWLYCFARCSPARAFCLSHTSLPLSPVTP
jgi:hypothetical protein